MGNMSNLAMDRDDENEEYGEGEGLCDETIALFDEFKIEHDNYCKDKSRDWVNSLSGGYDE